METEQQENSRPSIDIGQKLRAAREAAELSVEDIAADLRIKSEYIEAIENNQFELIQGETYVRGYIRSYARLVNINADNLISSFQPESPLQTSYQPPNPRYHEKAHLKGMKLGSILVALALLTLFVLWFLRSGYLDRYQTGTEDEQAQATTSAPPAVTSADGSTLILPPVAEEAGADTETAASTADIAPAPAESSATAAETEKTVAEPASEVPTIVLGEDDIISAPGGGTDEIMISLNGDSWVEIVDSSRNQLVHDLLPKGAIKIILGEAPFQVFLGNASSVRLDYNGIPFDIEAYTKRNNTARFALVKP
jgi:cytoskeleton protein RodZ